MNKELLEKELKPIVEKSTIVGVRVKESLKKRFEAQAVKWEMSASDLYRKALEVYIEKLNH
jgi:hypothetical protein